jgi:hypothetical protein
MYMRRVTGLCTATGILAAIAALAVLSTAAPAHQRVGGLGIHGGMGGFHGSFHHDRFHHHHGFSPGFGIGLGVLYGVYGWPGYDYDANPYYGYPYYPYYGGGYPIPSPNASGYGGGYPTPTPGSTSSRPSAEPSLPPVEVKPSAPQATRRPPKPASSDNAADPRLPDVRLTGIVIERDRRLAIFAVTGTRTLVLSEGEALKDWRLDSISPQKVSLSGPAGTMTLELFSPGPLPG